MRLQRVLTRLGFAVAACLALGISAGAAQAPKGRPLSGAEIGAALVGNTLSGKSPTGEGWIMWIAPDGKMIVRGTTQNGSMFGDIGAGTVKGDRWCVTWELLRQGQPMCLTVVKDGDLYRNYAPDGHLESTYTIRQGNPEEF
jgi:hypothetical protein